MFRPLKADINLSALRANFKLAKKLQPNAKTLAVMKANAYGHGMLDCARGLNNLADGYAVACMEEALVLHNGGLKLPVVLLEGIFSPREIAICHKQNFIPVIHQQHQLQWFLESDIQLEQVWFKLDSGMHRLGMSVEELTQASKQLKAHSPKTQQVLVSHFACADQPDHPLNQQQLDLVLSLAETLGLPLSFANSAALIGLPDSRASVQRPGIMMYGASPQENIPASELGLKPVMNLDSQVIAVRTLQPGESCGYSLTWQATQPTKLATVAIGYGDGYPRHAKSGTPVLVNGQRAKLAGRVSMDMITVDVTELGAVNIGDPVRLWGEGLPVDEIATWADTISYTLLTGVSPRVPRIVVE
ncbi:alanine racemase [Pelagibaculum spongiae]|uniref:Alanine racemase n=1 Tax=Pelagibaculum spongiae TaxID=2080658 RepID=A0A2V1GQ42_9GAMM|nr:alanine racemase [Pelagibaculum spongiae]PVZ65476.1 alanine racemase [Pelagibaculum spongiae]